MKSIHILIIGVVLSFIACEKDASIGDFLEQEDFDVLTNGNTQDETTNDTSAILDETHEVLNKIKSIDSLKIK